MQKVLLSTKEIERLLNDFYQATQIRISFISHDLQTSIELPAGKEFTPFCAMLREDPGFRARCTKCDREACMAARRSGELQVYTCHAGLVEAVSPIVYGEELLGYLMMGQTLDRAPSRESWERWWAGYATASVDREALEAAFYQLKCLNTEAIYAAARLMDIGAKYIHLSKMAELKQPRLLEQIQRYADENYCKNASIADLSRQLDRSASYLSHFVKANLHMSFSQLIRRKRIEKAKVLLAQSTRRIREVAEETGFEDQNYFARAFKKQEGMTPGEYRRKMQN